LAGRQRRKREGKHTGQIATPIRAAGGQTTPENPQSYLPGTSPKGEMCGAEKPRQASDMQNREAKDEDRRQNSRYKMGTIDRELKKEKENDIK